MLTLFNFQEEAAGSIAAAFSEYAENPAVQRGGKRVPFLHILRAITGSGKTPILASSVAQMRTKQPVEPIVLWTTKSRAVVVQTLSNFEDGGKYRHFVDAFTPRLLAEVSNDEIADGSTGLILMSTVATFGVEDKQSRKVFDQGDDSGQLSTWDALKQRLVATGQKRPLLIVYDEGHNSTDLQFDRLLELDPDAIILASATPRLSGKLREIAVLLGCTGNDVTPITTNILSSKVVECELVKNEIQIGGYSTADILVIRQMIDDYRKAAGQATALGLPFRPKCIYVTETNVPGDEKRLFAQREAPPIRIWRYLTDTCGVDPNEIAVYCNLKTGGKNAWNPPDGFHLFGGGENDFARFSQRNFRHIIFNLSLQEGWDDPECYFAYVDKSMGSRLQVTQIIGRVLRQPQASYYSNEDLNSAHFYIRIDDKGVFQRVLREVRTELNRDMPGVMVRDTGGDTTSIVRLQPKAVYRIAKVMTDSGPASEGVDAAIEAIHDYRQAINDARAHGERAVTRLAVASEKRHVEPHLTWEKQSQGLPVSVRWYLHHELRKISATAIGLCDTSDKKFDAKIDLGSRACAAIRDVARRVAEEFLEKTTLTIGSQLSAYEIGEIVCSTKDQRQFENAIHEFYSGLNDDEQDCANALDLLGKPWARNPSKSGFPIPLVQVGEGRNFYPDFIWFLDHTIWLIDTKGGHLIEKEVRRKLVCVHGRDGSMPMRVALISRGKYTKDADKVGADGITLWISVDGEYASQHYPSFTECFKRMVDQRI